ncbi:universal stress protein [Knoellia sp. CPCC 206453]|uniref:universal stress protein n=1 Tax=Knoellia pratensis TaxID=3404796 RepID=UPI003B42D258
MRTRPPEGPMALWPAWDHRHGCGMTDVHAMRGTFAEPLSARDGGAVVVGYDESCEGTNALGWAASHAEAFGVPLKVVYAARAPELATSRGDAVRVESAERLSRAALVARRGADRARKLQPDLKVHGQGAIGNPAAELIMQSASASVVVVGRRTTRPTNSLGSISFAVGTHARCPVVVVPLQTHRQLGPGCPVVVGVDGSASSQEALLFAAATADRAGADLVVLSAWVRPRPEPWMPEPTEVDEHLDVAAAGELEAAGRHVRAAVALVHERHPDVTTIHRVHQGRAPDALIEGSARSGLLVVGSRGRGGFAGLMLGSVSRAVLRRAEIPVAVVRNGGL